MGQLIQRVISPPFSFLDLKRDFDIQGASGAIALPDGVPTTIFTWDNGRTYEFGSFMWLQSQVDIDWTTAPGTSFHYEWAQVGIAALAIVGTSNNDIQMDYAATGETSQWINLAAMGFMQIDGPVVMEFNLTAIGGDAELGFFRGRVGVQILDA